MRDVEPGVAETVARGRVLLSEGYYPEEPAAVEFISSSGPDGGGLEGQDERYRGIVTKTISSADTVTGMLLFG